MKHLKELKLNENDISDSQYELKVTINNLINRKMFFITTEDGTHERVIREKDIPNLVNTLHLYVLLYIKTQILKI